MENFLNKIKALPPKTKRILVILLCIVFIIIISLIFYAGRTGSDKQVYIPPPQKNLKDITIEPNLLEQTALREQRSKNKELENQNQELLKRIEKLEANQEAQKKDEVDIRMDPSVMDIPIPDSTRVERYSAEGSYPPSVAERDYSPPVNPAPEKKIIGGISVISNPNPEISQDNNTTDTDNVKKKSYYLPPSFMEAGLLTGFNALTSGRGQGNTEPLLIKIQKPAILPNDVRARLDGCFIIAEAFGDLAKERADIRLITLSCVSKEGKSVIDSKIKGFVTDEDGKVGLSGRVVSKMGANIARSFIAGIFKGIGDGLSYSSVSTSTSGLGVTTGVINTDSDTLTRNALGSGLSEGADTLAKFYLDLAKQTGPVIEVKPGKKITAVISEGINLEIKEF